MDPRRCCQCRCLYGHVHKWPSIMFHHVPPCSAKTHVSLPPRSTSHQNIAMSVHSVLKTWMVAYGSTSILLSTWHDWAWFGQEPLLQGLHCYSSHCINLGSFKCSRSCLWFNTKVSGCILIIWTHQLTRYPCFLMQHPAIQSISPTKWFTLWFWRIDSHSDLEKKQDAKWPNHLSQLQFPN